MTGFADVYLFIVLQLTICVNGEASQVAEVCNFTWVSFSEKQSQLSTLYEKDNNADVPLVIVRAIVFGSFHAAQFPAWNSEVSKAVWFEAGVNGPEIFVNSNGCNSEWQNLESIGSISNLSIPIGEDAVLGRAYTSQGWRVCKIRKIGKRYRCFWVDHEQQWSIHSTSNPSTMQVLHSWKNALKVYEILDVSHGKSNTIMETKFSGTNYIRNKAKVTVTLTTSERQHVQKIKKDATTITHEIDIYFLKRLIQLGWERNSITHDTFTDAITITSTNTVIVPEETVLQSCIVDVIEKTPIMKIRVQDSEEYVISSKLATKKHTVVPMRGRKECYAIAMENTTTESQDTRILEFIQPSY